MSLKDKVFQDGREREVSLLSQISSLCIMVYEEHFKGCGLGRDTGLARYIGRIV
jgi:hypothetical protein